MLSMIIHDSQLAFTYSKSTTETRGKGVKYVQLIIKTSEDVIDAVLVFLLLTLNIFLPFLMFLLFTLNK